MEEKVNRMTVKTNALSAELFLRLYTSVGWVPLGMFNVPEAQAVTVPRLCKIKEAGKQFAGSFMISDELLRDHFADDPRGSVRRDRERNSPINQNRLKSHLLLRQEDL